MKTIFKRHPVEEPAIDDDFPHTEIPIDPKRPVENGRHADALLHDPMLLAAFDAVAEKYKRCWEQAQTADTETQILQHRRLAALKDVWREVRVHLTNAAFVKADMAARERREARRNDPLRGQFVDDDK